LSHRAIASAPPLLADSNMFGKGSNALRMPAVIENARAPPPPNDTAISCAIIFLFFFKKILALSFFVQLGFQKKTFF
jgi:hypothetical protein